MVANLFDFFGSAIIGSIVVILGVIIIMGIIMVVNMFQGNVSEEAQANEKRFKRFAIPIQYILFFLAVTWIGNKLIALF